MSAGVVIALAAAGPALAQTPTLEGVGIVGDPVVGSRLRAAITGSVDATAVSFKWCHQRDGRTAKCAPGRPIGTLQTYVPVAGDVGHTLLVQATATIASFKIEVTSAPTPVVSVAPPVTAPPVTAPPVTAPPVTTPPVTKPPVTKPPVTTPPVTKPPATTPSGSTPPPPGSAPIGSELPTPSFGSSGSSPSLAAPNTSGPADQEASAPGAGPTRLPYLSPFPVLRVRGSVAVRGARIDMLRVSAPRRATVSVTCTGSGCPVRRRIRGAGRIRAFERYLPAGLRITVRVTSPGHLGKYVRLVIRGGKPPFRRDACLLPGDKRAVVCPAN